MTAESLLEESTEAQAFLAQCRNNLQNFVLYLNEDFEEIEEVSLGAVGVDLQGETVTLATLEQTVKRVNEGPFWTTLYHDPTIHPVGRILAAKLFRTPSGATFVAALVGKYDRAKLPRLSDQLDTSLAPNLERLTTAGGGRAYLSFNPFELPFSLMEELIGSSPDSVNNRVFEERRKSAEVAIALLHLRHTAQGERGRCEDGSGTLTTRQ
jgi:hypothetical protein